MPVRMNEFEVLEVNLDKSEHASAVLEITDKYAQDPMGSGKSLPDIVKTNLIKELRSFDPYLGFLAFVNGEAAGLVNCFYGFSTFKASRLINIHDIAVLPGYRGMGIGQTLIDSVIKKAKEENCCKVTLEVREDNRARSLYEREGFQYGDPTMYFMTKELS
jgi:ribosomal protein S18 acetylase RimI-like enzyme